MTFEAKIGNAEDLKTIISSISTLVEEANFVATSEGITFRGMDPSHVALIDISWPNTAFERYECDSENNFGVRIEEFSKIVKRAEKKDGIEISISEQNQMLITIGKNRKYKIRLIESSATETPLPKITFDSKITLSSSKLQKMLGDVQVISDYLTIRTDGSKAYFSGKGDSGEVEVGVEETKVHSTPRTKPADKAPTEENPESPPPDKADGGQIKVRTGETDVEDDSIEIYSKEDSTGAYSLEYLNPVVKAVGNSGGKITCEFSSAKPLRVEFKVANMGRIHFYLAPRVES